MHMLLNQQMTLQKQDNMKKIIVSILLFVFSKSYGQVPKSAIVDYYCFDVMTNSRITPQWYDENYFGKYNTISINDSVSLKSLITVINTYRDTIMVYSAAKDSVATHQKCNTTNTRKKTQIDVRGEIIIVDSNMTGKKFFFNESQLLDHTTKIIYRMKNEFETYIRNLFPNPKYDEY